MKSISFVYIYFIWLEDKIKSLSTQSILSIDLKRIKQIFYDDISIK